MSGLNNSEGSLGHLYKYSTCRVVRAQVLYTIKKLAPQLLLTHGRCYCTCELLYTRDAYKLPHGRHVCKRLHVTRVDYVTDETCATVHVRHTTTDRSKRALPTRGHALPRVHRPAGQITNSRPCRSSYYTTSARSLHVGTAAHV